MRGHYFGLLRGHYLWLKRGHFLGFMRGHYLGFKRDYFLGFKRGHYLGFKRDHHLGLVEWSLYRVSLDKDAGDDRLTAMMSHCPADHHLVAVGPKVGCWLSSKRIDWRVEMTSYAWQKRVNLKVTP